MNTSINIPDEQIAELDAIAKAEDRSRSWVVRKLIKNGIESYDTTGVIK